MWLELIHKALSCYQSSTCYQAVHHKHDFFPLSVQAYLPEFGAAAELVYYTRYFCLGSIHDSYQWGISFRETSS